MTSLAADLIIWVLLAAGTGFGGIGIIGLLLLPDTRSRMYTSVRATLISVSVVALVTLVFSLYGLMTSGGDQYLGLLLRTLLLLGIVAGANILIARVIRGATHPAGACGDAGGSGAGTREK